MYWIKIYFLTCFIGNSYAVFSQNKINLPNSASDTNTVNSLILDCKNKLATDLDKAIEIGIKAKTLASKINFKKGEALAFKYIGIAYYYQSNYVEALDYYQKALNIFQFIKDDDGISNIENNIGAIYMNQGDDTKALGYFLRSLQIAEKMGNKLRILTSMTNVGAIYSRNDSTMDLALEYYKMALPKAEELKDSNSIGTIAGNVAEIYIKKENDSLALHYLEKSRLAFGKSEGSAFAYNATGDLYLNENKYQLALDAYKNAYTIAKELNNKFDIVLALLGIGKTYLEDGDYLGALSNLKKAEEIALGINAQREIMRADFAIAASFAKLGDYKNANLYNIKYSEYKDTLYNNEKDKRIAKLQFGFDLQKKEGQIDLLKKDNQLSESELKKQRLARNALIVGLIMVFIIAFYIYRNYRSKAKTNKILDQQNLEIERLLLNILPAEVAKELQKSGQAIPKNYEAVSVLFTDFQGFTLIADRMTPAEVVYELNRCFVAFDVITEKYRLEKIKTIGDSYLCAGGIPTFHENHVIDIVRAGIEMLKFIEKYNIERRELGFDSWAVRIGIHVGPLVAGVVGMKKYAYDIWGSTVNIASRMESSGLPGMINISEETYKYIKNDFPCNYRGKIHAKNMGDIDMYFVDSESISFEGGNITGATLIANNIQENEDKINHHGQRADAIVKGMLQHSRSSAGKNEPTDINVLADEYLRLAYHGYRAKEKSFNAMMKTDYDESIGKINIIPQDMGRVLLNLYNNAFYAVSQKKIQQPEVYEPTVSVKTKMINGKVEIRVIDNGNGIPKKVIDKIFQPFFTTKPAGQGTGLGLSLSYDIMKAHGGELRVESKEGEGSEFVVQIPAAWT